MTVEIVPCRECGQKYMITDNVQSRATCPDCYQKAVEEALHTALFSHEFCQRCGDALPTDTDVGCICVPCMIYLLDNQDEEGHL